jgi:hypothetical protein
MRRKRNQYLTNTTIYQTPLEENHQLVCIHQKIMVFLGQMIQKTLADHQSQKNLPFQQDNHNKVKLFKLMKI